MIKRRFIRLIDTTQSTKVTIVIHARWNPIDHEKAGRVNILMTATT
jgi:hypothetical protein